MSSAPVTPTRFNLHELEVNNGTRSFYLWFEKPHNSYFKRVLIYFEDIIEKNTTTNITYWLEGNFF